MAANGLLKSEVDNGDTRTYTWETKNVMASYLATVNIAQFKVEKETGPNGLPIRNYFPSDVTAQETAGFKRTAEMIEYFSGNSLAHIHLKPTAWSWQIRTWDSR